MQVVCVLAMVYTVVLSVLDSLDSSPMDKRLVLAVRRNVDIVAVGSALQPLPTTIAVPDCIGEEDSLRKLGRMVKPPQEVCTRRSVPFHDTLAA